MVSSAQSFVVPPPPESLEKKTRLMSAHFTCACAVIHVSASVVQIRDRNSRLCLSTESHNGASQSFLCSLLSSDVYSYDQILVSVMLDMPYPMVPPPPVDVPKRAEGIPTCPPVP